MDALHVLLAAGAGGGFCLAWGYRTALNVALGRENKPLFNPNPPPQRNALAAPSVVSQRQREEMTR